MSEEEETFRCIYPECESEGYKDYTLVSDESGDLIAELDNLTYPICSEHLKEAILELTKPEEKGE